MARAEVGTAKYAAKQMKASGLQKLRFYCQICAKQCRDDNGFKNHVQSPSHLFKIQNLSSNQVNEFSSQFEKDFLRLLKLNHGTKKVSANKYYQEYILNDKNHVHMNATRWSSLTQFTLYLQQKQAVKLEDDEKDGLCISYVDNSVVAEKKQKRVKNDEELQQEFIEEQIRKGKELALIREKKEQELRKTAQETSSLSPLQKKPIKLSFKKADSQTTETFKKSESPSSAIPLSDLKIDQKAYTKPIMKCGMMVLPVRPVAQSEPIKPRLKVPKSFKGVPKGGKKNPLAESDDEETETKKSRVN